MDRYVNPDVSTLEANDAKDSEICCTQHPRYEAGFKANRQKAKHAVEAYIRCRELQEASLALYQANLPGTPDLPEVLSWHAVEMLQAIQESS